MSTVPNLVGRRRLAILILLACAGVALVSAVAGQDYSGPALGATAIEYGVMPPS